MGYQCYHALDPPVVLLAACAGASALPTWTHRPPTCVSVQPAKDRIFNAVSQVGCLLGGGSDAGIAQTLTRGGAHTGVVTGEQIPLSEATAQFYQQRGYQSAWTGNDGLNRRGRKVVAVLEISSDEGLDPERYAYSKIRRLEEMATGNGGEVERGDVLRDLDLFVTSGLLLYATDLAKGALDPRAVGLGWHIDRGAAPGVAFLESVAAGANARELTRALLPTAPQYAALKETLTRYREIVATGVASYRPRRSRCWPIAGGPRNAARPIAGRGRPA